MSHLIIMTNAWLQQVDALQPGILGNGREMFAHRYCNRRLVRKLQRSNTDEFHWDNSGVSHAPELHALLTQVPENFNFDVQMLSH